MSTYYSERVSYRLYPDLIVDITVILFLRASHIFNIFNPHRPGHHRHSMAIKSVCNKVSLFRCRSTIMIILLIRDLLTFLPSTPTSLIQLFIVGIKIFIMHHASWNGSNTINLRIQTDFCKEYERRNRIVKL